MKLPNQLFASRESLRATLQMLALVGIAFPALAQNSAQPQYQGAQPQLVRGVEDGFADNKPKIRHVYMAAPNVLALTVDAGHMWGGPVQPYVAQPGDVIQRGRPQDYGTQGHQFFWNRQIIRNGVQSGDLVGPKEDHYTPSFTRKGESLDTEWAKSAANYLLSSPDDAAYRAAAVPLSVFRKTNPQMWEWTNKGIEESTARHDLYLKLPRALTPGKRYTLAFGAGSPFAAPVSFVFDDTRLRTEAIEVNQAGYHPRQTEKVARLFEWLGDGGGVDFSAFKNFLIVDDQSGKTAFRGEIKLLAVGNPARKMAPERTADTDNDLPAPLYGLDFSAFSTPGVYRVVVPGLGASFPFRIDENVWRDAAKVSATGFLNQRSGIALGPPYTNYKLPRDMHPADGFVVHKTDPAIFFDPAKFDNVKGGGNSFKRIQASILEDQTEPNAWGGWHDAADYDRSILPQDHPRAVHAMLELWESNPAYFEKLNLNLPESNNAIPDVLDEALWCMDLFQRIQQPDGGVPSAVESIEHPSEPSFLLGQPTAITPPTPQTCWVYSAAAARMSLALEKYDAARAQTYRQSALKAMEWAAKNPQVPNIYGNAAQQENLAAFWMYRLTNEAKWHDEFKRTLQVLFPDGNLAKAGFGGPSAVASYALLPAEKADAALQKRCREAVVRVADAKIALAAKRPYALGSERYNWDERLGQSWDLIAAHRLTGDRKYLALMEQQAQLGLGLNPSNTSYTTGIEKALDNAGIYPAWENWPWVESNFNLRQPPMNEHVIGGNMTNVLMTRAYLAQAMAGTR